MYTYIQTNCRPRRLVLRQPQHVHDTGRAPLPPHSHTQVCPLKIPIFFAKEPYIPQCLSIFPWYRVRTSPATFPYLIVSTKILHIFCKRALYIHSIHVYIYKACTSPATFPYTGVSAKQTLFRQICLMFKKQPHDFAKEPCINAVSILECSVHFSLSHTHTHIPARNQRAKKWQKGSSRPIFRNSDLFFKWLHLHQFHSKLSELWKA